MVINLLPCLFLSLSLLLPLAALSSVIASPPSSLPSCFLSPSLNPLYHRHVSTFSPRAPSCHAPLSAALFVFSYSCWPSFTPPLCSSLGVVQTQTTAPPPSAPTSPWWFIRALQGWTHTRGWIASWSVSDSVPIKHRVVYRLTFCSTPSFDHDIFWAWGQTVWHIVVGNTSSYEAVL